MQLSLTNIINISVAQAQAGIGDYNTSNVALFSDEAYANSFGTDGYKIYLSPTEVATDFGTNSKTYAMANALFSQKPNILAGNGYLVVIPFIVEVQDLALDGVPASGVFQLVFTEGTTAAINWNDSAAQIQAKIQAVSGLEQVTVSGTLASQDIKVHFAGKYGNQAAITVSGNTLQTSAPAAINFTITQETAAEDLNAAIVRTADLIQYFGVMGSLIFSQAEMLAAAATIQALNKIAFFVSRTAADIDPGGMLDLLRSGGYTQSRGLYYGDTTAAALDMMAAYVGRGLSTDFSGANTTSTMHLKDLATIQPDPSMTQTLLNKAQAAGVDVYASFQGVAKTFCSGENRFFDQVYNLQWFVGALQVAGFNFLAQSATKIPQTESGIDGLKSAYRNICEQAVTCQYSAPGEWQSATTFGKQADFLANIRQRGYYIYSIPVAQQSVTDRAARKAPLVEIALKEAGAVHSSSVIVFINA